MKSLNSILTISISLLSSFGLNAQESDDLSIQSIPITKNVSAILRTICFEGDKCILASNENGSDIEYLNSLDCDNNGVTDYSFIFSKVIQSGTSGIVRKIDVDGQNIIIYSGKNVAPTLTIQAK